MRNDMPLSLSPQTTYHLGNIRQVTGDDGSKNGEVIQRMNYYPFGAEFCDNSTKSYVQNHKYNGKEFDNMHGLNTYDYGARQYDPVLARWDRMDPLCEKFYNVSPYNYCVNNPVNIIDPNGCDTLNISYINGKWVFDNPIIAKGNDVFNVTIDGQTNSYTFSDGEYGSRMNVLNLESNEKETFGVYQLSGTETAGYVAQPKGPATKAADGSRLQDGSYNTIIGAGKQWPTYVGLINYNLYEGSGARVHYGTDHTWSTACLIVSSDYYMAGGIHKFNLNESRLAVSSINKYMGSTGRQTGVLTPNSRNPNRRIDRYSWDGPNKIGKAKINIKTR